MIQSCLIIAGEKSGEDHAMTFYPQIKQLLPDTEFYGVGGSRLEEQGLEILYHLKDFSGIGISEVLGKIPFYCRALDHILDEVKKRETKTAILVDFQGFNLKLAKKLKARGIKVLYYVAPQAWVWKPWRAKILERNVHTLFTILPFEKKWFQDRGVTNVKSVLHPLMLEYSEHLTHIRKRSSDNISKSKSKLLILPGSRNVEVSTLFPIFTRGVLILQEEGFEFELGIVKSESVRDEHYHTDLNFSKEWDSRELAEALDWADLSVAASGTVTLATGLFQVPTVVCYKVSLFTEFVLKLLVPYDGPASLTNIILGNKMIFPELIQHHADRYNVAKHLRQLLLNPEMYDNMIIELAKTNKLLTGDDFSVPDYMADVIKST